MEHTDKIRSNLKHLRFLRTLRIPQAVRYVGQKVIKCVWFSRNADCNVFCNDSYQVLEWRRRNLLDGSSLQRSFYDWLQQMLVLLGHQLLVHQSVFVLVTVDLL